MSEENKYFKKKKQLSLDIKQLERELKVGVCDVLPKKTEEVEKDQKEEKRDVRLEEFAETIGYHLCNVEDRLGNRLKNPAIACSELFYI